MKHLLLFLFSCCFAFSSYSQTYAIKVVDLATNQPIKGINLKITSNNSTVTHISDELGTLIISENVSSDAKLEIIQPGFMPYIQIQGKTTDEFIPKEEEKAENEKIFARELLRLEMSIKAMKKDATLKIVMTHYPPIGANLITSEAAKIFEREKIDHVLFHVKRLEGVQK